jgi:uncharacterized protein
MTKSMLNQAIPALRWAAAGLVAAAWLAPVALAQGNGTAGTAKKELVQKVLQLQGPGIESVGTQLAAQTAQQVLGAAGQALQRVPGDKRELLGTEIQADVKKFFDDVAPSLRTNALKLGPTILGTALEERLNEDELKTVVAWLESPVSRKFGQLNAEVQQALMQRLVTDSRAAVDPKLKALEQTLTKRLGAAAPAAAAPSGGAAAAPKK